MATAWCGGCARAFSGIWSPGDPSEGEKKRAVKRSGVVWSPHRPHRWCSLFSLLCVCVSECLLGSLH
uniref:Uncharacterized protein n=1 Tax=Arundo donax TaxID=35708 RepID=A0A0A9FCM8_ARUDO